MGPWARDFVAAPLKEMWMQRASFFLPTAVALALLPWVSAAARPAWNADRVTELASNLIEQTQGLEADLRASAAEAEAAEDDPDRAVGVGTLTLAIRDLAILGGRAKSYRKALEAGQGREETRSLFGRIHSLASLTATDLRRLPDNAKYGAGLEALEKTVAELGRFYAEALEVHTPPDPLAPQRERER